MTLQQALQGLKDGIYELDMNGHYVSWMPQRLLEKFDRVIELANGSNDDKWSSMGGKSRGEKDEINNRMRTYYLDYLNQSVDGVGDWWHYTDDYKCEQCGKTLKWSFKDGKIVFDHHLDTDKNPMWVLSDNRCEFEIPTPIYASINVDNGELIFANYFESIPNCDEDDEFTDSYDLCTTRGQKNITAYKAKHNVAFGQMGNMSVSILINKAKDHIVIANPYWNEGGYDDDTDRENGRIDSFPYKNYKKVGELCLCVWRWEAAPSNIVSEKDLKRLDEGYSKYHKVKVKKGKWDLTHYYETNTCPHPDVYSELRLIKTDT